MRERFERFMMGRYGADDLSRFMMISWFVIFILSMIFSFVLPILGSIFTWLGLFIIFYNIYRVFSRDTYRRSRENEWFLKKSAGFRNYWSHFKQRGTYKFFKCPTCGQNVRVPRGRGRIQITCPKCRTQFVKKS